MEKSVSDTTLLQDYSVVGYQPQYRREIVERLAIFWRLSMDDAEAFFRWKYQDCTLGRSPLISAVLYEGRVVGIRGAGSLPLYIDGVEVVAACMGDSWIDEKHRGKGLFGQLTTVLAELIKAGGIDLILNTTPSDKVHDWSLKNGWKPLNYSEQLLYPITREEIYAEFFDAFVPVMTQPLQLPEGHLVISETLYVDLVVALIERLESNASLPGVRLRRCAAFLKWRFFRPNKAYRFMYLFDSGSDIPDAEPVLLGFMVVTPGSITSLVSYCIADWCFDVGVPVSNVIDAMATNFPGYSFTVANSPEMLCLPQQSQSVKTDETYRTLILEAALHGDGISRQLCLETLPFYQRGVMLDNI